MLLGEGYSAERVSRQLSGETVSTIAFSRSVVTNDPIIGRSSDLLRCLLPSRQM